MEAGKNRAAMHDLLEDLAGEVKSSHPYKVKAIADAMIKTDSTNPKTSAHLLRADLIPETYIPGEDT